MYMKPGVVEVHDIDFPKLHLDSRSSPVPSERQYRKCEHGVILKTVGLSKRIGRGPHVEAFCVRDFLFWC